jgi:hypothetical protein
VHCRNSLAKGPKLPIEEAFCLEAASISKCFFRGFN